MAQNAPIIQVDCASCGTTYRLALPKVLVEKPHKAMSFRCNNCSYKFQIHPKEILEQPAAAETLILVESEGLQVHYNLESVADKISSGQYGAEDLIRVFGHEWTMMGDEPSLSALFDVASKSEVEESEPNGFIQNDSLHDDLDSSAKTDVESTAKTDFDDKTAINAVEKSDKDIEVEDVSLESDEDSGDFSEQFSEIDPFAVNSADDAEIVGANEAASETSIEDDDFDDWLVEELQDELAGSADDNDLIESESEDWTITESVVPEDAADAVEDLDELDIDESFTIEEVEDTAGIQNQFAQEFERDGLDDDFDDFAVEDLQANLLEELDLEESSLEDTVEALRTSNEAGSLQTTDVERTLQALKSDLLAGNSQKDNSQETSEPDLDVGSEEFEAEVAEVEVELDDIEATGAVVGSERPLDSAQPEAQKPKKRLSFSNKVPEVQKVQKREINQLYVFAGIIFFSVGVLGWVLWNSEPESQEFAGMEVNSNLLKEMETPKDGLQENTQKDGTAPELAKSSTDSDLPPTKDESEVGDGAQTLGDVVSEPPAPLPNVLPDVPEEGIDFANDKSPRALTREGYRALRDNKPDLAIKLFELALEKDPNFADAVLGLGRTHKKRGETQLAVRSFCRHSELPSSSFDSSTMVEEVGLSQNILAQMGSTCEG